MSKHYDIVNICYDEGDDGVPTLTSVERTTPYGNLAALAISAPEDADIVNKWDGAKIADYKIHMQLAHKKDVDYRHRAKGMKELIDNVEDFCDEATIKRMKKQYFSMLKRAAKEKKRYSEMNENYAAFCDSLLSERREIRAKIEKLHDNE